MKIYQVPVQGVFITNCYFAIDEASRHGFVIDPGAQGRELVNLIRQQSWTIEKILLTHGHFDHMGGVAELRQKLHLSVYCHQNSPQYLLDPVLNLSRACGPDITVPEFHTFADGDVISLQANPACQLQVLHTPGHTRDSVTFYDAADHTAFVGDAIFRGQPGSDEYPTGNGKELLQSIRQKILHLPENTILLSGHSQATTVAAEKPRYIA